MGSSWGIWSYLSQSNDSADMVPVEDRYKFCDDLSVIELINLVNIGIEDYDVRTHVPSNIPVHNQVIRADKLKSQRYIEEISDWTDRNKMVLNVKKTKNMIINFTDKYQFTTDLKLKGQSLEILKEHNLLGTWICDNLKWDLNTDKIVKASNIAMKCLHSAAKFINDRNILKQIYMIYVRSILEKSAVVWHSSITQNQIQTLERVQKGAMRTIFKNKYESYENSLNQLKLDKLEVRREKLCLNFAKKSLQLEKFKHLFPLNKNRQTRNSNKFLVNKYRTERAKHSSIPYMQSLLNKYYMQEQQTYKKLVSSVFSLVPANSSPNGTDRCLKFYPIK